MEERGIRPWMCCFVVHLQNTNILHAYLASMKRTLVTSSLWSYWCSVGHHFPHTPQLDLAILSSDFVAEASDQRR